MIAGETPENYVRRLSRELGFSFCGISRAGFLEEEAPRLEAWLNQNMHGHMNYMANHFDKRLDPTLLVPGAKSVISLLFNYYSEKKHSGNDPQEPLKISRYAYGEDYHLVIKDKLKIMMSRMKEAFGNIDGRAFVDSAPVMDKAWAKKSGLGWIGKNSNLINKGHGSYFFIAELITDLVLEPDGPVKDHCGTCTACIDACPTDAIVEPYVVDGSKCISYFTIELRESIPAAYHDKMSEWIFGCDICQDVCPWNRFSVQHNEPRFTPNAALLNTSAREWIEMSEDLFSELTKNSPVSRTGLEGMKRNVRAAFPDQNPASQNN
jgi:epoxyqueuosine reductase